MIIPLADIVSGIFFFNFVYKPTIINNGTNRKKS